MKFLFQQGKFVVLENYVEYIVKNVELEYKNHAHIKKGKNEEETLEKVKTLIHLLENGICPKSKYFRGSAYRLLGSEEYKKLRKKDRYFNPQKGAKRAFCKRG